MLRDYPNELRADLQRYYGINLDDVYGGSVSLRHAAAISVCLPNGSRTLAKIDPKSQFGYTEWLLLGILNSLREEPVDPFEEKKTVAMTVDEYERILSLPRKGV